MIYSISLLASAVVPLYRLLPTEQPEVPFQSGRLFCFMSAGNFMLTALEQCLVHITGPVNSYWVKEGSHWILLSFQSTFCDLVHTPRLTTLMLVPQFIIPAETLLRSISKFSLLNTDLLPTRSNFSHWIKGTLFCVWGSLALEARNTSLSNLSIQLDTNHSWFYLRNKYCLCSYVSILIITVLIQPCSLSRLDSWNKLVTGFSSFGCL